MAFKQLIWIKYICVNDFYPVPSSGSFHQLRESRWANTFIYYLHNSQPIQCQLQSNSMTCVSPGTTKDPVHPLAVIRTSWTTLTNEIESIGVLTFLHMFEKHPNMKNTFKSFKHLTHQELQTSEIFHNHAARVVNVVKKVIT